MSEFQPDGRAGRWRFATWARPGQVLPPLVALAMLAILARQLSEVDFAEVGRTLAGHSPLTWALAVCATGASFVAIGRYDVVIHRQLRTGVTAPRAARSGMQAAAVAQVTGFGLVTGSLVRWRSLPELSLADATRVTATVGASFIGALTVLLGIGALTGAASLPPALGIGGAALLAGAVLILGWAIARRRLRGRDAAAILFWVALDTGFAALTLWLFLPPGLGPMAVYAAFVAALGAGILSNAPGGVGAFEVTLLAILPAAAPEIGTEALVSAIVAHRLSFYVPPALAALPGLVAPKVLTAPPLIPVRADDLVPPHPDWALRRQGARVLARPDLRGGWLVRAAPGFLVAFGSAEGLAGFDDMRAAARRLGRPCLFYKLTPEAAAAARREGLTVARIAAEALLDPRAWTVDGPGLRQLRRKLRQADRQGIEITEAARGALPLDEMIRVNAAWRRAHGPEKGFSMGRFSPSLVERQVVFLARRGGRLVAFASFNAVAGAWSLDLMRHGPEAPPGTMHGLVAAGIARAGRLGVARLSLAAVPDTPTPLGRLGLSGLCQFKDSFGPAWQPLYAAAGGRVTLALGLAAVAWAIHRPHDQVENFGFELRTGPWHGSTVIPSKTGPVTHVQHPDHAP